MTQEKNRKLHRSLTSRAKVLVVTFSRVMQYEQAQGQEAVATIAASSPS